MRTEELRGQHVTENPGLSAATGALLCELLEERSPWLVFLFGAVCMFAADYMFLHHDWIFVLIEAVWSVVAFRTWWLANRQRKSARHYR